MWLWSVISNQPSYQQPACAMLLCCHGMLRGALASEATQLGVSSANVIMQVEMEEQRIQHCGWWVMLGGVSQGTIKLEVWKVSI